MVPNPTNLEAQLGRRQIRGTLQRYSQKGPCGLRLFRTKVGPLLKPGPHGNSPRLGQRLSRKSGISFRCLA